MTPSVPSRSKGRSDLAPFISYAQHGEDVILWRALGDRERVFYIDVGAFDPTYDSVTRALYERGWRGINIEPQPEMIEAFERQRPEDTNVSLAIGDHDGKAFLTCPRVAGWATTLEPAVSGLNAPTDRTLEVPMRRLDTLLPELGVEQVDILKIDVEGAEPAVIRGLLGSRVRPLVCVVEGVAPGVGHAAGDEAVAMLVDAGYIHCLFDGLNHYLTTDPALQQALSVPANPVDGHTRVGIVRLEQERSQLLTTIMALTAENLRLQALAAQPTASVAEPAPVEPPPVERPDPEQPEPEQPETVPTKITSVLEQSETELNSSSHLLPTEVILDVSAGPVPRAPAPHAPAPAHVARRSSSLESVERTARRRATFARLLQGEPVRRPQPETEGLPLGAPGSEDPPVARLLTLAMTDSSPDEATSMLYRAILGREADEPGLRAWSALVESGHPLPLVARALVESEEGLLAPPEHRGRILADLMVWESIVTLDELGVATWHPDRTFSPGETAHEIFVGALHEVAFQRRPTPDEASLEVAKLVGGTGRESLMRAYAAQPEVRSRMLGMASPGLRGRLRHWQNKRRHM
ncbi:MAG: hypothetical protein QOF35_2071, partial [Actinomycetota bacterium]|nr:hypothetical protein [Actinomycetota bacterium]